MTRDMAKAMCQHFMDARLIENAVDPSSNLFKDRGVYVLTPKGLHVLERFISRNGITADKLQQVFATQPICVKLLHLERRSSDDEIIISQSVITALFRRFVGRQPNTLSQSQTTDAYQKYNDRAKGVPLQDITERAQPLLGRGVQHHKHCFPAVGALEWLCDFTSVVGREEAAEMAAQFVRFGLITLVSDKRKNNDSAIIFTVRGSSPGGNSVVSVSPTVTICSPFSQRPPQQQGEFRCTAKALYRVTDEGRRVAHWDTLHLIGAHDSPNASSSNLVGAGRTSVEDLPEGATKKSHDPDAKVHRRISLAEKLNATYEAQEKKGKESNAERLRSILEEPPLRSLFREFLRGNFSEENLSFWMDVQDLKRKFNITSSAAAVNPNPSRPTRGTAGQAAMEQHHDSLIHTAFQIYNKYLAPSSQCELNIDHGLRNELVKYLEAAATNITGPTFQGRVEPEQGGGLNATKLQEMIRLYERIQGHVFRLMATDSIPKVGFSPPFTLIA